MPTKSQNSNQISASVRALYRIIGRVIGKQIFDRIISDNNFASDPESRRTYARQVIDTISAFRRQLAGTRDFKEVEKIFRELFIKEEVIAIKQLDWVLEAYLLLNQSSTASAQVAQPEARMPDRLLMTRLIDSVRTKILQEKNLSKIFTKDFSMNLVLTAHPTAGIQPDYIHHIKNLVTAIQKIAFQIEPSEWQKLSTKDSEHEALESSLEEIMADVNLSISHMVRALPYNLSNLSPLDESINFLENIQAAWEVIPSKILSLENELRKYLGNDFRIHSRFFRLHSWVARDIDGNPTVTKEEHLLAIYNERINFLSKYRQDLQKLWQNLSDDFSYNENLPAKTFFVDQGFHDLYQQSIAEMPHLTYKDKAYRVVLQKIISSFDAYTNAHFAFKEFDEKKIAALSYFDIEKELVAPLELIRTNKQGVLTQEIDKLIRKAQIFGIYGSHGHTRQDAKTLGKLVSYLTALWDGEIDRKTSYILDTKSEQISYETVEQKIIIQYTSLPEKQQKKLLQTFGLLTLSELGAIKRQIISMNQSFEDMLNVLVLSKFIGGFKPSVQGALPSSRLEIVPLTEQISDLRSSYQVTLEALCNPAWQQYLIANKGRFYKMRGPSDSGKQNGFFASQWYMFRSKQLDTIVVEIFNSFLQRELNNNDEKLKLWKQAAQDEGEEAKVINLALEKFSAFFTGEWFDKRLWQHAQQELELEKIRLINFDGWGEPIERGGGLEFKDTVKDTQPNGSLPYYERTLQGGGAQQFSSELRTKQAIQDFISGVSQTAVRRFALDRVFDVEAFKLDKNFVLLMEKMVKELRLSLRSEVFGLDLEDDNLAKNEQILRDYFRHVIKSPLVFLDLFNIASRPTSRSGSQIKEFLNRQEFAGDIDGLIQNINSNDIISILADVRAIPYAAMFTLLGGNHVSFYGFDKILENNEKFSAGKGKKTILDWVKHFYNWPEDTQEHRLIKHLIDSLERGVLTADQDCYRQSHEIIEHATNPEYKSGNDLLILKFLQAQQSTLNFIAAVREYKVKNPNKVTVLEIMQNDQHFRDLLLARRNDAAVPRMGIAFAMSLIFKHCKEQKLNPLDQTNIPPNLLDLLRKAFAAGASTFGNGCID